MRTFFALDLTPRLKLDIERWRDLALPGSDKSIPSGNFHVTLCFNGDVHQQQLEALEHAASALKVAPFALRFNDFGYFTKPGIAFLGCKHSPSPLLALNQQLEEICRQQGLPVEKRVYVPHISLFRRLTVTPPAPVIAPDFQLDARAFTLFESVALRQGVRYQPLAEWPLNAPATR